MGCPRWLKQNCSYINPQNKRWEMPAMVYKFPGRVLSIIAGLADLYLGTLQGQALPTAYSARVVSVHFACSGSWECPQTTRVETCCALTSPSGDTHRPPRRPRQVRENQPPSASVHPLINSTLCKLTVLGLQCSHSQETHLFSSPQEKITVCSVMH